MNVCGRLSRIWQGDSSQDPLQQRMTGVGLRWGGLTPTEIQALLTSQEGEGPRGISFTCTVRPLFRRLDKTMKPQGQSPSPLYETGRFDDATTFTPSSITRFRSDDESRNRCRLPVGRIYREYAAEDSTPRSFGGIEREGTSFGYC